MPNKPEKAPSQPGNKAARRAGSEKEGEDVLQAGEGWRDSVRGFWTKNVPGADIQSILRDAEAAEHLSNTALENAQRALTKMATRNSHRSTGDEKKNKIQPEKRLLHGPGRA